MARYVVSDHHFGHANIIEYCDRPFSSVGQMDSILVDRHYQTVEPDDVVVHLGDVAMDMQTGAQTIACMDRLNADVLVRGNHDVGLAPDEAPFPVLEACVLEHEGQRFYCTHRPEDVPEWWDGWVIHGHHHNNDTDAYPFLAADECRFNVGVELLNYRPIALGTLATLVETCPPESRFDDVEAASEALPDVGLAE